MATQKLRIEIEPHLASIDKEINKYEKNLSSLKKKADDMGFGDNISKEIEGAIDKLTELRDEYSDSLKKLADGKISTEAFEKFSKEIDARMDEVSERLAETEQNLHSLQDTAKRTNFDSLDRKIKSMKTSFGNFKRETKEAMIMLQNFQKLTEQAYGGKELKQISDTLKSLGKIDFSKMGNTKPVKSVDVLQQKLSATYTTYLNLKNIMEDKSSTPGRIKSAEDEISKLLPELSEMVKQLALMKNIDIDDIFTSGYKFKNLQGQLFDFDAITKDLDIGLTNIKERLLARSKELKDIVDSGISTTVSSFTFTGEGIKIPVILDESMKDVVEKQLLELVETLSNYSQQHPVDVTLRLFPLKADKKEAKEISNYLKDVRAQIPKIENKELADSIEGVITNLEKEYQKALELNIQVKFSQTKEEIEGNINAIRTMLKKEPFEINPRIKFKEDEAENVNKELEKFKGDFSVDFANRLQKLTDSLNNLLDEGKVVKWSSAFTKALREVSLKLEGMKNLVQPLAQLYSGSTGKRKPGRPSNESLENRNVVDKFTDTIDLLNKTLAERDKKPKLNAAEFTKDIQNAIDAANIPVQIPIEPELEGFAEQIEDGLKTIPINIAVGNIVSGSGDGGSLVINASNATIESSKETEVVSKGETTVSEEKKSNNKKQGTTTSQAKSNLINGVDKKFIDDEFKNVYFGKRPKKGKGTKDEREKTREFSKLYKDYGNKLNEVKKLNTNLDSLDKNADDYDEQYKDITEAIKIINDAAKKMVEENPVLSKYKTGVAYDNLLGEYLQSQGINKTASISSKTYYKKLKQEAMGKGDFGNLRNKGNRDALLNIVKQFIGYKYKSELARESTKNTDNPFRGGYEDITDLTDNPKGKKQLQKYYDKLTGAIKENANAKKEAAEQSEQITRKSAYEGISTEDLKKKYSELAKGREELIKVNREDLVSDSDEEKVKSIAGSLEAIKRNNKEARQYRKKGAIDAGDLSFEEVGNLENRKEINAKLEKSLAELETKKKKIDKDGKVDEQLENRIKEVKEKIKANKEIEDEIKKVEEKGFSVNKYGVVEGAKAKEDLVKGIKEGLMEKYGLSEDIFKGINQKNKKQTTELAKDILAQSKAKKIIDDIDSEMKKISTEISLREKETEEAKKAAIAIQNETANTKENIEAKKESIEVEKEVTKAKAESVEVEKTRDEIKAESKKQLQNAIERSEEERKIIDKKNKRKNRNIQKTENTKTFAELKDFVSTADLRLNSNEGKQNLQDIISKYAKYVNNKGKKSITELSDNTAIQDKLKKAWDEYTASIKNNTEEKKKNETVSKEQSDGKAEATTESETKAVQKQTQEVEKNTKAKKENNEVEENFNILRGMISKYGSLPQNTNEGKYGLAIGVSQYQRYVAQGGTRPITDLTDDVKAQGKLKEAYEKTTAAIKEQTNTKKADTKPAVDQKEVETTKEANVELSKRQQILNAISKLKKEGKIDFGDLHDNVLQKLFNETMEMVDKDNLSVKKGTDYFTEILNNYKANYKTPEPSFIQPIEIPEDIDLNSQELQNELNELFKEEQKVTESIQEEASAREKNAKAAKEETNAVKESNDEKQKKYTIDEIDEFIRQNPKKKLERAAEYKKNNKKYGKLTDKYVAYTQYPNGQYNTEYLDAIVKRRSEFIKAKNQMIEMSKKDIEDFTDDDMAKIAELEKKYYELSNGLSNPDMKFITDLKEITSEYNKAIDDVYDKIESKDKNNPSLDIISSSNLDELEEFTKRLESFKSQFQSGKLLQDIPEARDINIVRQALHDYEDELEQYKDSLERQPKRNSNTQFFESQINEVQGYVDELRELYNFISKEPFGNIKIADLIDEGKEQAEAFTDAVEAQKPNAKQSGADLGNATNEGVMDATDEHSPSKVAEMLGYYYGIGWKQGLEKSEPEIIAAIKALMEGVTTEAGKSLKLENADLFADNVEDQLKSPIVKYLSKEESTVKGQLTKVINKLNNSDAVNIDKTDALFEKYVQKAEKLGMDIEEARQAYKKARSKFILDEDFDEVVTKKKSYNKNKKEQQIPTDAKEKKKVISNLRKEQKDYYKEILNYEKQIGIAQADEDTELANHYKAQKDISQKLYEETTKQLESLADENTLQQQSLELTKLREKNEKEIADIIANRINNDNKKRIKDEQKFYEEGEKRRAEIAAKTEKQIAEIEKNNLRFTGNDFQRLTDYKAGVIGRDTDWYKDLHKGNEWTGALQTQLFDEYITKSKELLQAEKDLDKITKEWEKSPEIYADALEEAKEKVHSLFGEIRDLSSNDYLSSLSDEQIAEVFKVENQIEEIQRKRQAKAESNRKQSETEVEKQVNDEINNLLKKQESSYKNIWDIRKKIAGLDETKDSEQIQALKQKEQTEIGIYNSYTKQLKALDNTITSEQLLANYAKIRKDAEQDIAVILGKQTDKETVAAEKFESKAAEIEAIKKSEKAYTELNNKVKEYIKLRKLIAQGKAFDDDIAKVAKLENEIVDLNVKLKTSDLFNPDLEEKVMSGIDTIEETVSRIRADRFTKIQNQINRQSPDIDFEKQYGKHTAEFESTLTEIQNKIAEINAKPLNTIQESDIEEAKDLLNQIKQIRRAGNLTENRKANENSLQKNLAQVNSILSENTKRAFKRTDVYQDLVNLQKSFRSFDTSRPQSELAELTTQLLRTKARFEDLDNTVKGKNLFQTFIERLHGTSAQLIAQYLSWMDIIRYLRTMATTIIDLDTQLVDLRKTTSMTSSELEQFYNNSSDVAKQLGVTTSEIISQAAAWSRLGYSSKEAATEMAKLSSQFTSISPGMTTENATDYLVSTMQAYGIAVDDVERKIMDNVNKIGNTFATTNAEIGEMLTRSSAAMNAANNSLEETIALESAAVEVTRNAEMTGTAFRTVSMRIRGKQLMPPYSENYMLCA